GATAAPARGGGRVGFSLLLGTAARAVPVGIVVAGDDGIRGDRAAIVLELAGDAVARGSLFGLVAALQQPVHVLAVLLQHLLIVSLRPRRLRQPPQAIHGVLDADLADVDPLRRRGQLARVVPVELLRNVTTDIPPQP